MEITLKAMAKINLFLNIIGVLDDGYHDLDMVMQSIDLYDTVTLTAKKLGGITISCDQAEIPCDESNIAYKAAHTFFQYVGQNKDIHIHIKKKIPHQAGLGGGSADGAAVLAGLNRLLNFNLPIEKLCEIGLTVSADIPFCITGGTCRVQGIGEKIIPVSPLPDCKIVLIKPDFGISTKDAYEAFDRGYSIAHMKSDYIIKSIENRDLQAVSGLLFNVLEPVAKNAPVKKIKEQLLQQGAIGASMTGSGSAVFGIFLDEVLAQKCAGVLKRQFAQVFLAKSVSEGIKF